MAKWMFGAMPSDVEPSTLAAGRALLAFAILSAYMLLGRRAELRVTRADAKFLGLFGVFGLALVHYTYFKTLSLTNVATAILLEYLAPVLILLFAVLFLGKRLDWTAPLAVAMSVLGCAMVVGAIGAGRLVITPAALGWGLASAVAFAAYSIMGRQAAGRFRPLTLLTYGLGAAAAFWLVVLGPRAVLQPLAEPRVAGAVVVMAVVSTIVPFGAYLAALEHIEAANASITATLEPLVAAVAAFVLFHRPEDILSGWQIAGGALVLAAILVVQAADRVPVEPAP